MSDAVTLQGHHTQKQEMTNQNPSSLVGQMGLLLARIRP